MCGVFGIIGHPEAARMTYLGLYALQHRGQESAGIASVDGGAMFVERGMGHVADVFDKPHLDRLPGRGAIGHIRYSTAGESKLQNAQPIRIGSRRGAIALCHNGNLVNAGPLRQGLEEAGAIFTSTSDTEVILHLFARSQAETVEDALVDALGRVSGAYSIAALTPSHMLVVRDPYGFRPLSIGHIEGAWVVTSESNGFDLIGAEALRDVAPGEIMIFEQDAPVTPESIEIVRAGPGGACEGYVSHMPWPEKEPRHCIFEHVYFARPDSKLYGDNVLRTRKEMGRTLGREAPAEADVVVPVPDGGVYAAQGYSEQTGIPYEHALIRNHYVGRTFIEPRQSIRHFGVKVKLNPVHDLISGKRVVLVDDSIVRGTTSGKIVEMIRNAGATEVHVRISSPPYVSPCYYGIDTPRKEDLIAANHSLHEIGASIGADSLAYLSLDGLRNSVSPQSDRYCVACFTGCYPTPLSTELEAQMDLFLPVGAGPAGNPSRE
jgi:amidophosphoribosyltransferase